MSILLIGEKNSYHSRNRNTFADKHEIQQYNRQKKYSQEKYRAQLFKQMEQNQEKRKRQKHKEIQINLMYEKIFQQQLAQKQKNSRDNESFILNLNNRHQFKNKEESQKISQQNLRLPQINYHNSKEERSRSQYKFQAQREIKNEQSRYKFKPFDDDRERSYDMGENYLQNPEIRKKRLQEELDSKANEVYRLITQSVKALNLQEQSQNILSKINPIKLNLKKKKYKVKNKLYTEGNEESENEEDFYKLPHLNIIKPRELTTKRQDPQANWRRNYAKRKMLQLQKFYQEQVLSLQNLEKSQYK